MHHKSGCLQFDMGNLGLAVGTMVALGLLALTACGSSKEFPPPSSTPRPTIDPAFLAAPPTRDMSNGEADLPEPVGRAVWNFLQEVNYRDAWELWPGKGEKFQGGEPHGALHTIYVSPSAFRAVTTKAGSMPDGAIVVKENFTADGIFDLVTLMYKRQGFDPENNDWFWAKFKKNGEIDAEGRIPGCQACHGAQKDNDYIWAGPLK